VRNIRDRFQYICGVMRLSLTHHFILCLLSTSTEQRRYLRHTADFLSVTIMSHTSLTLGLEETLVSYTTCCRQYRQVRLAVGQQYKILFFKFCWPCISI